MLFAPLTFVVIAAVSSVPDAPSGDPFNEEVLAAEIWRRAPAVLAARQDLIDADAVRGRSYLLPNPLLTGTWGTIPLGERNASNAGNPGFWDVPNYTVGVGQLFELGKRGPRQRSAESGHRAARFTLLDAYRQSFFALLESLTDQAAARARVLVFDRLVEGSEQSLRLQQARADKGDVAPLDVDRLQVDHVRLLSARHEAEAAVEGAVAACTQILARLCPRFQNEEDTTRFLNAHPIPAEDNDTAAVNARPDVLALDANQQRLQSELALAEHLKIPDPVVGVSYTHDAYIAAGNQANSLTLTLTFPLPIFDRGQPEVAHAHARILSNQIARKALSESALLTIKLGREQLGKLEARARVLDQQGLPLARSVYERMDAAARRGGAALPEVLMARRDFQQLQLERVDVAVAVSRASLEVRRAAAILPEPQR